MDPNMFDNMDKILLWILIIVVVLAFALGFGLRWITN